MSIKPKLEIKQYHGDGKYDYAIFRSDRERPICSGISREHAEHIERILNRKKYEDLPESFPPIKDWRNHEDIVGVDENGYGKVVEID